MRWTLQAPDGEFNIRIASGLTVGEDLQGKLEFAPTAQTALAQFELEGGAVRIHLVSRDWSLARNDRTVGDNFRSERTLVLRLPHNVIRIVGGENPTAEPEHIELRRRVSMKWLLPNPERTDVGPVDTPTAHLARPTEDVAEQQIRPPAEKRPAQPDDATVPDSAPPRIERTPITTVDAAGTRRRSSDVRNKRVLSPLMAALIGVGGGIAIAILYQALSGRGSQAPTAAAVRSAEREPVAAPAVESVVSAADAGDVASVVPEMSPAANVVARPTAEKAGNEVVAAATADETPRPVPEPVTAPVEPVVASAPSAGPDATQTLRAAASYPRPIDRQPNAAPITPQPKASETQRTDQAKSAEQTRVRLLRAADVALAEGRLTTPPETSAYAFYQRILALNPKSPEALNGLKLVRQGLINRTLAQLAANALDDARVTLQEAADAGVNPPLVADLRGEVDYRQRLSDARAGRFETLYPVDQLVAISQEPPQVPRDGAMGAKASVEVQFTVTTGGEVRDVEVLNTPPDKLERAVRHALSEWRFEPVLYNGRPMPVRSSVRFDF